ncbi:radical SAM protein [Thermostilla marina]
MFHRLFARIVREIPPRILLKAGYLWVYKGNRAMRAFRRRRSRGEIFPPFLFLALTNACNLRCRGCWIESHGAPDQLSLEDAEAIIEAGKSQASYFYTLLGGEPFLWPHLWDLLEAHPECYFQIITNGLFLDDTTCKRLRALGNVTPLVSLDGLEQTNDQRRGEGTYVRAVEGLAALKRARLLFGVATTITAANADEVLSDDYIRRVIESGAMYLWYYVFRPVGADPSPELAVSGDKLVEIRRKILAFRRRHPIIIIDTYWDAEGRAVCPAAHGLGYHIDPKGGINPCPPLSFAAENVRHNDGRLVETINQSRLLQEFGTFVHQRTRGCVILEQPHELADFLEQHGALDTSGRDAYAELRSATPRPSHHQPGREIPEDYWLYRFLKRRLFFGMGAYA